MSSDQNQFAPQLNRRALLGGSAGIALGGFAAASLTATTPAHAATGATLPDFSDPRINVRTHVRLVGSVARETVISFMRLNIYAYTGEGNFLPMFTMNNLLVDHWEPLGDDEYQMTKFEAGIYTAIDGREPLEEFVNPVTGQTLPIHNFRLGPVPRLYSPDGYVVMSYNPNPLPIEVIGDRVFLATQSLESMPSMLEPGATNYVNSFMTYSAPLASVLDAEVTSLPVHMQLQNFNHWAPWMDMAGQPGGTVARGFGSKVTGFDALPPGVLDGFERHVPEILDTESWTEFVFEDSEFLPD
ncbi:MAG: DUF1838 family protein [Gammaproteobacteria bacterium]|nr:DUF1838 family protein [Gammaproteobacteria bacterium]